ncbi:DNA repair RAD52-like protein 1, mitochondrial isoform X3 [Phaseolus vulgaris]|uniref:Uncharacterized protein n=1 Tax=Phaseolus vulgaris TaxID=3885 RepID=V7ACS0_PHAVU|nr:hypothetical protein PHAVU_011G003500g [Phaseolus vulgaris]ESW03312.1 hypothetical protein PHAVU_011G003500g [Phaseolus vulgaris]
MASGFVKLEKLSRVGGAFRFGQWNRRHSKLSYRAATESEKMEEEEVPTSGISRPLSEILKELNKKVPDSLVRTRLEKDGFPIRYIPWHLVNRILNLHAPGMSGLVRFGISPIPLMPSLSPSSTELPFMGLMLRYLGNQLGLLQ